MSVKEWTTMRVRWKTKIEFLKQGIGRETDDEILQRLLVLSTKKNKMKAK